jgi:inhibitor of KinA sporulation pathway (predicted exonuclease)
VNLKQRFAKARRLERPLGLNGALQLAGMQFKASNTGRWKMRATPRACCR